MASELDAPLYNRIAGLSKNGGCPMHMPGHKRNTDFIRDNLLTLDFTEIEGTDNMHHPEDVILQAEERLAQLNGCDRSLFLINGGSSGILTAILGTVGEGDKIIVCRNAHKSVHNALVLSGAVPVYIYPEVLYSSVTGSITPQELERAFTLYPNAKAVLVTSPTYEGYTAYIAALAKVAHRHSAILISDETHGAHFVFSSAFPKSAISMGADISINSWHKTLPCPNQSAVININTKRVDMARIMAAYSMVQSTSPSYIMLALMDKMRAQLTQDKSVFEDYIKNLTQVRTALAELKGMRLINKESFNAKSVCDYDISKLVLLTGKNFSGKTLAQILLKEYNVQIELADPWHIIAMTSCADTKESLMHFAAAVREIDRELDEYQPYDIAGGYNEITSPVISPRQAFYGRYEQADIELSAGLIAGECITPFPPDVPLIITGERITVRQLELLEHYRQSGTTLIGGENGKIKVIKEERI